MIEKLAVQVFEMLVTVLFMKVVMCASAASSTAEAKIPYCSLHNFLQCTIELILSDMHLIQGES